MLKRQINMACCQSLPFRVSSILRIDITRRHQIPFAKYSTNKAETVTRVLPGSNHWTRSEEELLVKKVLEQLINEPIPNVRPFMSNPQSASTTSLFSQQQQQAYQKQVVELVRKLPKKIDLDAIKWEQITEKLPYRSTSQCRERFLQLVAGVPESSNTSAETPVSRHSPIPSNFSSPAAPSSTCLSNQSNTRDQKSLDPKWLPLLNIVKEENRRLSSESDGWRVEEEIRLRLAMRIYKSPRLLKQLPNFWIKIDDVDKDSMDVFDDSKVPGTRRPSIFSRLTKSMVAFGTNWETVAAVVGGTKTVQQCKLKWDKIMRLRSIRN